MQIVQDCSNNSIWFLDNNLILTKKWKVKTEILNQSPKLIVIITFLLFNYLMLTIRIVKYYSEVENSTSTNIEYHYSVPTIRIFEELE